MNLKSNIASVELVFLVIKVMVTVDQEIFWLTIKFGLGSSVKMNEFQLKSYISGIRFLGYWKRSHDHYLLKI